jgi:hypothetical protein
MWTDPWVLCLDGEIKTDQLRPWWKFIRLWWRILIIQIQNLKTLTFNDTLWKGNNFLNDSMRHNGIYFTIGRAIAEAVSCWLPTVAARVQSRDLLWTKWRRGRFSPSTSVSPAIHSTKFSILTITRCRYNRPVNGRRAEWTQFGLHPPLCKLKKNFFLLHYYFHD